MVVPVDEFFSGVVEDDFRRRELPHAVIAIATTAPATIIFVDRMLSPVGSPSPREATVARTIWQKHRGGTRTSTYSFYGVVEDLDRALGRLHAVEHGWARLGTAPARSAASMSGSTPVRTFARRSRSAIVATKARGTRRASARASVGSTSDIVCSATNISVFSRLSSSSGMKEPSSARSSSRGASPAAMRSNAPRWRSGHVLLGREQQLILGPEVVLHEANRHAGFGRDLAERRRGQAALHRDAAHRVGDLPPADRMIHSLRHSFYGTPVS